MRCVESRLREAKARQRCSLDEMLTVCTAAATTEVKVRPCGEAKQVGLGDQQEGGEGGTERLRMNPVFWVE